MKRENLLFTGLEIAAADTIASESALSCLVQQVVRLCNEQLGCDVKNEDTSFAQAIPLKRNAPPRPNALRMVVVKFTHRIIRDNVYASRTKLKTYNAAAVSKIFINKDLASVAQKLFADLPRMIKDKTLLGTWTNYNKMYIRKLDNSVRVVSCLADIR